MHHIGGGVGQLGDPQEPVDGLRLHLGGPGKGMAIGAGDAPILYLLDHLQQHVPVFTMYPNESAETGGLLQGLEDLAVVHPQGVVDHVHFIGSDPLPGHLAHFGPDAFIPPGNGHVEPIVAAGALGFFMPGIQCLLKGTIPLLGGEIQYAGGTAQGGGFGAGDKIVRRDDAAGIQVEMGMGVDKAWKYITALGLDHLGAWGPQLRGKGNNAAIFYQYIHLGAALGIDNGSVFDERLHRKPPEKEKHRGRPVRKKRPAGPRPRRRS